MHPPIMLGDKISQTNVFSSPRTSQTKPCESTGGEEAEGNLKAAEIIRKIIRHEVHNKDLAVIRALSHPQGP
jgi:hypothetical protein